MRISETITQEYQDVPRHETGQTSSVGALWPPEAAMFGRVKGFYNRGIITEVSGLRDIQQVITQEGNFPHRTDGVTRVTLRAVVDSNLLREYAHKEEGEHLEGVIPLHGTQPALENAVVVYYGKNAASRQSNLADLAVGEENLREALAVQKGKLTPKQIFDRVSERGYAIGIISLDREEKPEDVIDEISGLYERFGWKRDEVAQMVVIPTNIMAVARKDQRIVSAGIAELAEVPIGGVSLRIAEITEAATADGHTEKGLYTAVSTGLVTELNRRSAAGDIFGGELDYLYGECNSMALGVLKCSQTQGRTFSREAGRAYGYPNSGRLIQHVPISGVPRNTDHNDLFPSFLSRQTLYDRYGGNR